MATATAHQPEQTPDLLYSERYEILDAFRGLAALAVVINHVFGSLSEWWHVGSPAVMVFFVISGYCIAAGGDACQRKGLTFGQFMWRRFRRIYPPYLLSLIFYVATRVLKLQMTGVNDLDRPWLHWVQNITLTQWFSLLFDPAHHPNHPSGNSTLFVAAYWSLGYEEQFYLVMGLMILLTVLTGIKVRTMVTILGVLSLAWIFFFPKTWYGLFIEFWSSFAVGALVFYRLCRIKEFWARRAIELSIVGVFLLSVIMRATDPEVAPKVFIDWFRPLILGNWHALIVTSLFALLLLVLRPLDDLYHRARWLSRPLGMLGTITYSLYLIHQFNLNLVQTVVTKGLAFAGMSDPPIWLNLPLQTMLHVAIATVFWYFCERPFLNKSLLPSKSSAPGGPVASKPKSSGS